ncbi:MAG: hypothetical protein GY751_03835 [Bacteroidetes bacterium]|nr:hypothetical protein [Bacteroidota bacterium]
MSGLVFTTRKIKLAGRVGIIVDVLMVMFSAGLKTLSVTTLKWSGKA